ncbi:MAG: molecular chaperone TorD family protein [Acidimicrobiia bacterium]|nr:molecular chaperone TorD family protein [Acidimicrobiia bacterium]
MATAGPAPTRSAPAAAHTAAAPARAELWWVLADVLSYPSSELAEGLRSGAVAERITTAAAGLPYSLPIGPGLAAGGAGDTGASPEPGSPEHAALGTEYLRLFEVPGPSGRPCPLRVGSYGGDPRSVMEELLRVYRHFGLTTAGAAVGDLPDGVATVAEFLAFLATLEATAPGGRAGVRAAQRDLLARHLVPAATAIAGRIGRLRPSPVYRDATALLATYAGAEAVALGD